MSYTERANTLFASIVADLQQHDGEEIVAAILADQLRNWAWNRACAGMIAGNKNRHPHHRQSKDALYRPPQQPETD